MSYSIYRVREKSHHPRCKPMQFCDFYTLTHCSVVRKVLAWCSTCGASTCRICFVSLVASVGYCVSDLTVMSEGHRDRVFIDQRSHLVLIYCLQLSCRNCTATTIVLQYIFTDNHLPSTDLCWFFTIKYICKNRRHEFTMHEFGLHKGC